jgi:hypothetical protein
MSLDEKIIHEKLATASPDDLERKASLQEGESLAVLGYKEELTRNRSLWTLLFQSLAIAAVPYGEGSPLISAIYGGGQLSMFLGWIVILVLDECIALSLGEFASRYPTSGGPSYWSFRMSSAYWTMKAIFANTAQSWRRVERSRLHTLRVSTRIESPL